MLVLNNLDPEVPATLLPPEMLDDCARADEAMSRLVAHIDDTSVHGDCIKAMLVWWWDGAKLQDVADWIDDRQIYDDRLRAHQARRFLGTI